MKSHLIFMEKGTPTHVAKRIPRNRTGPYLTLGFVQALYLVSCILFLVSCWLIRERLNR